MNTPVEMPKIKNKTKTFEDITTAPILTTGHIAALCHVASRTVAGWIDRGFLPGFTIPGTKKSNGDRRVYRNDFINFLQLHNMTEPLRLFRPRPVIVSLNVKKGLLEPLEKEMDVVPVSSFVSLGLVCQRERPNVVVLSTSAGRSDCLACLIELLPYPYLSGAKWVVFIGDDDCASKWPQNDRLTIISGNVDRTKISMSVVKLLTP